LLENAKMAQERGRYGQLLPPTGEGDIVSPPTTPNEYPMSPLLSPFASQPPSVPQRSPRRASGSPISRGSVDGMIMSRLMRICLS